ncbi:MAG: cytochrome o ubiquinol oxidase subunit IV [Verrucomicrobia bacterium]|nr:cytochrome o ubiquinol oxidase subunit IV [Verrucomicrobiota bacterium]
MIDLRHGWNASFKPQFLGFVFSLLLTVAVYRIVTHRELTDSLLTTIVVCFCSLQALIQLFFFLHLGMESKPQWSMITFLFTVLVVVVVIGGTLWIMNNLNYDLMPTMGR